MLKPQKVEIIRMVMGLVFFSLAVLITQLISVN